MKLEGLKINFLGDSITHGDGVKDKNNLFWARMKRDYNLKEARGYGICGARFARQKNCLDKSTDINAHYSERYKTMDDDADVIFVFGGTNDFGHGDAPFGNFEDRTVDTFYGACHCLFSGLMEKYPGKVIVIATPLHRTIEDNPRGHDDERKLPGVTYGTLKDYVNAIIEVAKYYSLPVCDLYSISGITPKVESICKMFCPDGLHPNDAGHKLLEDRIANFLQSL